MIAAVPIGATRKLAEDQDEFHNLMIRDRRLPNGAPFMESWWQPTPDELAMLNAGGCVTLGIMGTRHPPVHVGAAPPAYMMTDEGNEGDG